ncbi:MAG TPA: hypothetical protein VNC50_13075 [Planctomycetia bacterium]|jgi:hypothetical protein|nr:hypothetical protein [Planctomycetia bacterium]
MEGQVRLQRFNAACFTIILASTAAALAVGIAGIWEMIPCQSVLFWRLLATCGGVFLAATTASMAIAWFRANE